MSFWKKLFRDVPVPDRTAIKIRERFRQQVRSSDFVLNHYEFSKFPTFHFPNLESAIQFCSDACNDFGGAPKVSKDARCWCCGAPNTAVKVLDRGPIYIDNLFAFANFQAGCTLACEGTFSWPFPVCGATHTNAPRSVSIT